MQELSRSTDARDQAIGRGGHEDSDLCTGRTEVHHMDWWWYPCWIEYFQKGKTITLEGLGLIPANNEKKMWVSADEWHEDPEIIHRKFV